MKIYDSNSGIPVGGSQRSQETQQTDRAGAGRTSTTGGEGGDRVEFSGTLGRLSRVLSTYQSDRSSRVEALTAQYQSGSYQPDSMVISRAMISEALGVGVKNGLE